MKRKDDTAERTYFRSDRIFFMNGKWYFSSREGDRGPFATREYAERMLARFIDETVELSKFQRSRGEPDKLTTLKDAERLRNALKATSTRTLVAPELLI
jgi:Domain of unknown function (DUF6316)